MQDGGAAQAAMGDEEFLAEAGAEFSGAGGCDDFRGETSEVAPAGMVVGVEDERDEGGPGVDDAESEVLGEGVSEAGGSHLGDGEAAGGDDD